MKKALKISAYILGGIVLLLLLVFVWLNTDHGKNFLREKTVAFLEDKLKTEVSIGRLDYDLPSMIELEHVLFRDQANDTLLSLARLRVDISMLKLLSNKVEVEDIQMQGGYAHIYRNAPDTSFNFNYVVEAFMAPPAADQQDAPTDSSGQFQLDVQRLVLDDIRFTFDDQTGGAYFATNVDQLVLRLNKLDPYNLDFRIRDLNVNGLNAVFIQDTSMLAASTDTAAVAMPYMEAGELNLRNVNFVYEDRVGVMEMEYHVGALVGHPSIIDMQRQNIVIDDLKLDSALARIEMGAVAAEKAAQTLDTLIDTDAPPAAKWRLTAEDVQFANLQFIFDNFNEPRLDYGVDYAHLNASDINLNLQDLVYTTDTITGNIVQLRLKEQSGFALEELQTQFAYHPEGAILRDLYLQTPQTVLRDYAEVRYPSLEALQTRMESLRTRIHLTNSRVGMRDVLLFAPDLRYEPLFRKYGNDIVSINATVEGFLNQLEIEQLALRGFGNTYVDISGQLNGMPDVDAINYDLEIAALQSNKDVVNTFLPATVQQQVDLPHSFSITGNVAGTLEDFDTDLYATTSDGNARINGTVSMSPGIGRERYNMVVRTERLNIGKIMRQEATMGRITANISARGQSFDINYMDAMLKGEIQSAAFMGYAYKDVQFTADVAGKAADVNLVSRDPNAVLDMEGNVDFKNEYPAVVARVNIDSADLQALQLSTEPFRVRAVVDANFPVLNPDYPEGTVSIDRPTVVVAGSRYFLDSMYIVSQPHPDSGNYIVVNADALMAVVTGRTPLTQIGNVVMHHVNRHYALNRADSAAVARAVPARYDLEVDAILRDRPLMHALLPGLRSMDTVRIRAGLTQDDLFVNADMPRMQYNDILLQNGKLRVNEGDTGLGYSITLDRLSQDRLEVFNTNVNGRLYHKELIANVSVSDSAGTPRFGLSAAARQEGENHELNIRNGLMLNYETWNVEQPNRIVFGDSGFYVQNFQISKGGQSIALNSEAAQFNTPMSIAINDFLISNVTEVISKDTLIANGLLNGNLTLANLATAPEATGELSVTDLSLLNDTMGNLLVTLSEANANEIASRVEITGRGNDITVDGSYYPSPVNGNNFDLDINIAALQLRSFEGLAAYQIRNSTGYIRGNLKLQGTMTEPRITGELRTDNLGTTIAAVGSHYTMPAEVIEFTGDAIAFRNFALVDSFGNQAIVDGRVFLRDFKNMGLDLTVRARRWHALSSTSADNELFYGTAVISTNMSITGTSLNPVVGGSLSVHDSTNFTVVVPQVDPGIQEREGVVAFVDKSHPNRYNLLVAADTTPKTAFRTGLFLNMNVDIDENARFNIIIDEASGDFIEVRGVAALNTTVNPDGSVGITGVYELKSGAYELNYNFIRRRFDILEGSTITFAGDPLDANMDLTAAYTANIPPYDLVAQQVNNPEELVYFKQRLPFQVLLNLDGALMKPDVTFDIVLPEDRSFRATADVVNLTEARLAEVRRSPSELNKQVFAVLILGRFVGENPFENGVMGSSASFMAKQSASRFIGDQLNRFSNQLITGVDLNFDLQSSEDYTTGQRRERTDLSVSASKRLLNDRLKVTLGNDFGVGGTAQSSAENSALVPSNISLDYLLTPEGRYTWRLYRENDNRELLDRSVVETGTSFIVRADYNRFRQLFMRRKKMMERRMRERRWKEEPIKPTQTRGTR